MRVSIRGRSGRACASPSFVFALFPLSLHLAAVGGAVLEFALRVAPPVIAAPAALAALVLPRIGGARFRAKVPCTGARAGRVNTHGRSGRWLRPKPATSMS